MITARTMTITDYSVSMNDVEAQTVSINQQAIRAVLVALAVASNQPPTTFGVTFESALGTALQQVSAANYGLDVYSLDQTENPPPTESLTSATATLNVTSTDLKTSWTIAVTETLTQDTTNIAPTIHLCSQPLPPEPYSCFSHPFAALITFQIPITLALNTTINSEPTGRVTNWLAGYVNATPVVGATCQQAPQAAGCYPVILNRNYGNGQLELEFSLPYTSTSPQIMYVTLTNLDANMIAVTSTLALRFEFSG
jgi:hypothetical protein